MGAFNFYINIDQCLNMSNFDMFFYKLQNERRFHLSNVRTGGGISEDALRDAFHGIRSYLDRAPFMILDYRLIFGLREPRRLDPDWKETVLYRQLCIYYGLLDEKIFIRSREKEADKNVSIIMLYDTDMRQELPPVGSYSLLDDVKVLMRSAGVDWTEEPSEDAIADQVRSFLKTEGEADGNAAGCDAVTARFLNGYLKYQERIGSASDFADDPGAFLPEKEPEGHRAYAGTVLQRVLEYAEKCVGHYCVFQKEIDSNSVAQSQLAMLSIVDYILMDLDVGENDDNSTLRSRSIENWKKAASDTDIQRRYGEMMFRYRIRLDRAGREIRQKLLQFTQGNEAPSCEMPERLETDEGFGGKSEKEDQRDFDEILDTFEKESIRNDQVRSAWSAAYEACKEKLGSMETDLRIMAGDVSRRYRARLEKRDEEAPARLNRYRKGIYSRASVEKELLIAGREEEKRFRELEKPVMTPSLQFQDQLNFENELEQSNLEIQFYAKCQSLIRPLSFLILVLVSLGICAAHHLFLQRGIVDSTYELGIYGLSVAVTGVLLLLNWRVPYVYFQKRIREVTGRLKEKMHVYIRGYYEKAENFVSYIHLLDETDALNGHMELITAIRDDADRKAQEYLWHRARIREHLRRCEHFEDLINSVGMAEPAGEEDTVPVIDCGRDVIPNPVYWPQG